MHLQKFRNDSSRLEALMAETSGGNWESYKLKSEVPNGELVDFHLM